MLSFALLMPGHASAENLDRRIERLEPHFTLLRPDGAGPFPVVIMLHGCGGRRPFMAEMAETAVAAGAAALIVDSHAPRRISRIEAFATVCTGARLHGRERAGDLFAAMEWVRRQDWADASRIGAIGWSHGGWTILDALSLRPGAEIQRVTGLQRLPEEPLTGLTGALVVYPYAGFGSFVGRRSWRVDPPVTAIVAGRDFIVGDTRSALARQQRLGSPLNVVVFENATHAFEDAEAEDPRVRFDAAATQREQELLRAMIAGL